MLASFEHDALGRLTRVLEGASVRVPSTIGQHDPRGDSTPLRGEILMVVSFASLAQIFASIWNLALVGALRRVGLKTPLGDEWNAQGSSHVARLVAALASMDGVSPELASMLAEHAPKGGGLNTPDAVNAEIALMLSLRSLANVDATSSAWHDRAAVRQLAEVLDGLLRVACESGEVPVPIGPMVAVLSAAVSVAEGGTLVELVDQIVAEWRDWFLPQADREFASWSEGVIAQVEDSARAATHDPPADLGAVRLEERIVEVVGRPLGDDAYWGVLEYLYPRMSDRQMTAVVAAVSGKEPWVVYNDVLRVGAGESPRSEAATLVAKRLDDAIGLPVE
ncbi:MAG: hypothetical protein U0353_22135 [Sandaracinus sp.]